MDLDEDAVAAAQLLALACAGDNEAFGRLTAPHRRELLIHCYRMLGSLQDAEDALQETLLAAWQALAGFELRSSLRTWLYTIATHRCLNARRATRRRPPKEWDVPGVQPPMPSRLGEVVWLEPLPDELVASGVGLWPGPETVYEQGESISLAFITALQVLPPRQLAVLVLRDVLGFRASEVAPPAGSPTENALVAQFVRAYESSDVDALIALLTDDVFMSMPPMPFEYEGKDLVAEFWHLLFRADRKYRLIPTRANGQPAFGSYVRAADGLFHCTGLFVLTLAGNQICALTRFETTTVPRFGLPRSLPSS